jgi:hypothetical protein
VVVILDKHFKLNSKGAPGDAKVDNKDKTKNSGFDEQSRRAAEVIRAAGYVTISLEEPPPLTIVFMSERVL